MSITRQRLNRLEKDLKEITHKAKVLVCEQVKGGYDYQGKVYRNLTMLEKENSIGETDRLIILPIIYGEPKGILKNA